ncbi:hypothetical protein Bbelb_088280 [Branchiostoma belcheri]|nr:hypothetical protein Bbelb_088280 [Branchiostoma belcheri]
MVRLASLLETILDKNAAQCQVIVSSVNAAAKRSVCPLQAAFSGSLSIRTSWEAEDWERPLGWRGEQIAILHTLKRRRAFAWSSVKHTNPSALLSVPTVCLCSRRRYLLQTLTVVSAICICKAS